MDFDQQELRDRIMSLLYRHLHWQPGIKTGEKSSTSIELWVPMIADNLVMIVNNAHKAKGDRREVFDVK